MNDSLTVLPAVEGPLSPLSHGQQALWLLYREAPDSTAYRMALPLRFAAPIAETVLAQALAMLAERHPMLRARHLPYRIATQERDQWLACMIQAMENLAVDPALAQQLAEAFFGTADWMRNTKDAGVPP